MIVLDVMEYYGLVGTNALAVYTDEFKLEKAKKYVRKHKVKSYSDKENAMKDTIRRYNDLLADRGEIDGYCNQKYLKLNWVYYKKNFK